MQQIAYPVRYLFGLPIASLTIRQTVDVILETIRNGSHLYHVSINATKIIEIKKDKLLLKDIQNSDMLSADGQPVVWASRILGKPLPQRVTGIDLMNSLIGIAPKHGLKIYFLGARERVVEKMVNKISLQYGKEIIAGFHHGYLNKDNATMVAMDIAKSGADILFVAMPSPRKIKFLNLFKGQLNVPVIIGVGGSFDVVSGEIQRAPVIFQQTGLEWLYRLVQEPRRLGKRCFFTMLLFPPMVIMEIIKKYSINKKNISKIDIIK